MYGRLFFHIDGEEVRKILLSHSPTGTPQQDATVLKVLN